MIVKVASAQIAAVAFDAGNCLDKITASLDIEHIVKAKYRFDAVGYCSRPDVFNLSVNETEQAQLTIRSTTD